MPKINKNEIKVLTTWAIVGLIIMILVLVVNIKFGGVSIFDRLIKKVDTNYSIVTDRDRYYIVKTSVDTYYAYLNEKNVDNILAVLDKKYVENKKLDKSNVLKELNVDKQVAIKANTYMCQRKVDSGLYSYYTHFIEEDRQTGEYIKDVYYEVKLDHKTIHYTIKPISEKKFGGACNGE